MNIGITGQSGFIGSNLLNSLRMLPALTYVDFSRTFWDHPELLQNFVNQCDVIIHLAGVSRSENPQKMYDENILLGQKLITAISQAPHPLRLLFASTTHEHKDTLYHQSKRDARKYFQQYPFTNNTTCCTMLMPNTFGPGSRPFYNSVVSTFCCQTAANLPLSINSDATLELIYIDNLCANIIELIYKEQLPECQTFNSDFKITLHELAADLAGFKKIYSQLQKNPDLPLSFNNINNLNLWNTYLSYQKALDKSPKNNIF